MASSIIGRVLKASIAGVHAHQVLLQMNSGKGDARCFAPGALRKEQIETLVAEHAALVAAVREQFYADPSARKLGREGSDRAERLLTAGIRLSQRLPVNVFVAWLKARNPTLRANSRLSLAHLYQTCLEVGRDGTLLQDLYRMLIAMGLPVHLAQVGLPCDDESLLAMGAELAGQSRACPFPADAAAWQLAGRKIENWGEKNRGLATPERCACEIMTWPEIAALLPQVRNLPPRQVAVIGHSFTMNLHWSTPGSFTGILEALFKLENPGVRITHYGEGGLRAAQAREKFYEAVLRASPHVVLFSLNTWGPEDMQALEDMTGGFQQVGIEVWCMDQLWPTGECTVVDENPAALRALAGRIGLKLVEVGARIDSHPDRPRFFSLDKVHMTGYYHKFMAGELLKFMARSFLPARCEAAAREGGEKNAPAGESQGGEPALIPARIPTDPPRRRNGSGSSAP